MSDVVDGDPPRRIRKVPLSDFWSKPLTRDQFTGKGRQHRVADRDADLRVPHVRFEAGAMTHPHFHKGSQILWFLDGAGEVGSPPNKVIRCKPGEVVRIDPFVVHWHGAARNGTSTTSHLAITVGETVWENDDGWDQRR
jgi:quercetin dioxygenase-like cupin family protein